MENESPARTSRTNSSGSYSGAERRHRPRITKRFRATVHGINVDGQAFAAETTLDNISAGGLYLRLQQCVEVGMPLLIVSKLSLSSAAKTSGPLVAISGKVLRSEKSPEGWCGVAVEINNNQFL